MVTALQIELPAERLGRALGQVVKYVKVALASSLLHHPRFLEQILSGACSEHLVHALEDDFNVLAEAGRVVVEPRLGVAKRLEQRLRLEDLLLEPGGVPGAAVGEGEQVVHKELGRLGLARTGLARHDANLITVEQPEILGSTLSHSVDVRHRAQPRRWVVPILVLGAVHVDPLVRVDRNEDISNKRVHGVVLEALFARVKKLGLCHLLHRDQVVWDVAYRILDLRIFHHMLGLRREGDLRRGHLGVAPFCRVSPRGLSHCTAVIGCGSGSFHFHFLRGDGCFRV
mmetsp:Transcript_36120/g.108466  ORF Transcript_36120/g.108466 Transcript_36120/m.108466 type:complete len:285 (+) Transcript_36120:2148-3002(+)